MPTSRLALAIMLAIPAVYARTARADPFLALIRAPMVTDTMDGVGGSSTPWAGLEPSEGPRPAQDAVPSAVARAVTALPARTVHEPTTRAGVRAAPRHALTKAPAAKKHTAQARAMPATLPRAVVPTRSAASPTDAQIIERLRKELATKDAEIAALRAELTASRAAATVQLVPATKESPTVIALSASQLNREGMAAMSAGNYPVAVDKFRRAADLNDVAAIANLGTMYLNGSGVARDPFQALQLLVRAANGGNRTAAENLGTLSEYGIGGVAQNPVRAYQWYQVAARLGSVTVQTSMARIRAQGN